MTFAPTSFKPALLPTHARALVGTNHSVAIACSFRRDSSGLSITPYESRAQLVSPSRDPIGFSDGASLYRAYFAPQGLDPRGLTCRKVCCRFRLGWVIPEFETKQLDCDDGKSAADCCKAYGSKWYRLWATDSFYDGPCVRTDEPMLALAPTPFPS